MWRQQAAYFPDPFSHSLMHSKLPGSFESLTKRPTSERPQTVQTLKEYLEKRKKRLLQYLFAKQLNVQPATVSRWLAGKRRPRVRRRSGSCL